MGLQDGCPLEPKLRVLSREFNMSQNGHGRRASIRDFTVVIAFVYPLVVVPMPNCWIAELHWPKSERYSQLIKTVLKSVWWLSVSQTNEPALGFQYNSEATIRNVISHSGLFSSLQSLDSVCQKRQNSKKYKIYKIYKNYKIYKKFRFFLMTWLPVLDGFRSCYKLNRVTATEATESKSPARCIYCLWCDAAFITRGYKVLRES